MEVNFVEERTYERREPILVSHSSPLPREFRSKELVAAGDEHDAEPCEHFTIRGYVSGTRKKDATICWPFFMFHNHKSDEYANWLPPLPVTNFRRWNCQKCMLETNAPAAAVANGALSKSQNIGSTIVASHADERILLPGIQHLSEEKIQGGQLAEVNSSINVRNGKCRPSICCTKKENESVITDLTTEGSQIPKASHDSCEEIQNQSGDTPTSVISEGRACQMGSRGQINVGQAINSLRTAHGVVASDLLCYKSKVTELDHETADSVMAADPKFIGNNVELSGQKQCNDPTRHVYDIGSVGLDENDHKALDNNTDLDTVQCPNHASKVLNSSGKLHQKKARKVRLIDDIIRSEELGVMSQKVHIPNGDAKAAQILNDIHTRSDASKGKDVHLDHKSHLAEHKAKAEPIKSKVMYKALGNKDDGSSLMYWLKWVNKKPVTHKGDAENKHINTGVVNSKSAADASVGKGLDLIRESSGSKGKLKKIVHRKQNEMPRVYIMPQQDIMTGKALIAAEDAATKNFHAKTVDSEFKGIRTTGKSSHYCPKIQDRSYKNAIVSKKKYMEPQFEDNESSPTHLSKDSFDKHDHAIITAFQGQKRVNKKRRTTRLYEKEALDDIPMDIVELLARNQHERQLLDAGTGMMHHLSEMPENKKAGFLPENKKAGNPLGTMVLDSVYEDLFQRETLSNNTIDGIRSKRNVDGRPTATRSPSSGKQNIDVNLNRQDLISASTRLAAVQQYRNQPMSCVLPPKSKTKNNCFAQSYSWDRAGMQASESCHTDRTISVQNPCRDAHGWSSGTRFVVKPRYVDADSNHINMMYHDSLPQRKLKSFARETDNVKLVNRDGTGLLNSKEQAESSIHKTATSFAKAGNTLSANDIMPAMHLLKLMDSATRSGPSLHKPSDINHVGCIQENDSYSNCRCNELAGLEGRLKTNETPRHLSMIDHTVQDQHHENSCKAFRPLPIIGVLGSLLQKEITTRTNNCGTQSGFQIGHSNAPASREPTGTDNSECSNTATRTRAMNVETPISRDENTEQLFSAVDSHPGCSQGRDDVFQVSTSSEKGAVQPLKGGYETEICGVNRNPADFTILGEDNAYMIASEVIRPRSSNVHKRQKVMKLNPSKGLVRI